MNGQLIVMLMKPVSRYCGAPGVVHQLIGSEGANGVQEEIGCLLKVPDGHAVHTLIHLESVPTVPVSSFFYKAVGEKI